MISPNRSACERQKGEAQLFNIYMSMSKYLKHEDNSKCYAKKLSFWFSPPDSSVFKRGLWAIAIEWPSRNLHDFVQNFLVLSMHIFKVRISFRKACQIALQ